MKTKILTKDAIIKRGVTGSHIAVDLYASDGTLCDVLAFKDGVVTYVQTGRVNKKGSTGNESYGNMVKLSHSDGSYTLYAHLNKVYVSLNNKVHIGQAIGEYGNTGNSYGAHLHFEIRKGSTYNTRIDPLPYIMDNTTYKPRNIIEEIQNGYNLLFAPSLNHYIKVDGSFGNDTKTSLIKALQYEMNKQYKSGLVIDGRFGNLTKNSFMTLTKGMSGNITWLCQAMLYVRGHNPQGLDKMYGDGMEASVIEFQNNNGLTPTGKIDKDTAYKLFTL